MVKKNKYLPNLKFFGKISMLLILILEGCSNNAKFKENFFEIKNSTVNYFIQNKDSLFRYSKQFQSQDKIVYLRIVNENNTNNITFYSRFSRDRMVLYKIELLFNLDELNLIDKLSKDKIVIFKNGDKTSLENFTKIELVEMNYFQKWLNVLQKSNLTSISSSMFFENTICFTLSNDGRIIHNYGNHDLKNTSNERNFLERIDDKWYFYFVTNTAGFF